MATYVCYEDVLFQYKSTTDNFCSISQPGRTFAWRNPELFIQQTALLCDLSFLLARPQRPHRLDNHCPLSEYKLAVVPLTIELLISLDRLQHIRCRCSGNSEWSTACHSTSLDSVSVPVMREKSNTKRILLLPH